MLIQVIASVFVLGYVNLAVAQLTVPYKAPVTGFGRNQVIVRGTPTGGEFAINFRSGESDIALHFDPRLYVNKVFLNSFQGGSWGAEEITQTTPFTKDKPFEIVFDVKTDVYEITVDGTTKYTFKHRIPPQKVDTVEVLKDISLQSVTIV